VLSLAVLKTPRLTAPVCEVSSFKALIALLTNFVGVDNLSPVIRWGALFQFIDVDSLNHFVNRLGGGVTERKT
jgi:hypothetical protein